MRTIVYVLGLCLLNSCVLTESFVSFSETQEGGLRVKNPNRLKFWGKPFHLDNTTLIDTAAIYLLSNYELANAQPFEISGTVYCRFFPHGQVLFVPCDGIPDAATVNNLERGWQGYYKIKHLFDLHSSDNRPYTGFL